MFLSTRAPKSIMFSTAMLFAILLSGSCSKLSAGARSQFLHTQPERWSGPRNYQTAFDSAFKKNIEVSSVPIGSMEIISASNLLPDYLKFFSPNGGYWFAVNPDVDTSHHTTTESDEILDLSFSRDTAEIFLWNEKEYLIKITLRELSPNYSVSVRWINEHLLFFRVWWGKILGSDLIFDIEKEQFLYRTMVHEGTSFFQQARDTINSSETN